MTPDTKAIVEKLTNEGLLLRNNGTNSIRSVKVELNKFHDTFKALSSSMQGITGTLQGQTKLEELRDEREAKIELLDDKERKDFEKAEKENIKSQQKLDSQKLAQDLQLAKDRDQKDFKVFGKNGIFASTLSGAFNVIKKTLFFGIVGAIGYQVLAGAVEALAPSFFGKDVKMPDLFDGFSKAGAALAKLTQGDWDGLVENVKAISSPVGMLAAGYVGANVAGTVASGTIQALTQISITKALARMLIPGPENIGDGMKAAKITPKLLKGGMAGLIFAGLYSSIDPIMNFMRKDENMTATDIANTEVPTGFTTAGLAGAATIASLFVPGGALLRAAAGIGMFLVGGALKAIDYARDDDNLPNKIEAIYAQNMQSEDQLERLVEQRRKAMMLGADPAEIEKQIAALKKKTAEDQKVFKATFDISTKEDQAAINDAKAKMRKMLADPEAYYADPANRFVGNPTGGLTELSKPQLQAKFDKELKFLEDKVALNQSQLDKTAEFGRAELGMSDKEMGLVTYNGLLMTVESKDAMIKSDLEKVKQRAKDKREKDSKRLNNIASYSAEDQEYLKVNNIDPGVMSKNDLMLKSISEMGNGMGSSPIINFLNKAGDTNISTNMSAGGAKTNTTIFSGLPSNQGGQYCAFPGAVDGPSFRAM